MRPFYPNIVQYVPKKLHLVLRLDKGNMQGKLLELCIKTSKSELNRESLFQLSL